MYKLYLVVFGVLFVTSAAMADHRCGAKWKGKHAGRHADRLVSELQLTDEQKQPVIAIVREQRAKGKEAIRAMRKQLKPQMEALHSETRQRLSGILDEEQLRRFDEMRDRRKQRRGDRIS